MRILVTGASGFIGSHLCEALCELGHDVIALHRNPAKLREMQVPGDPLRAELSVELEAPNRWVDELPDDLDAVAHVAGLAHSFRDDEFHRVNCDGTERLVLDLAERFPRLRFVFISSLAAAGPSREAQSEDDAPRPVSAYGRSKRDAEQRLGAVAPEDWETAIIRPPMVIGPRDPALLDVFKMVRGRIVTVPGFGGSYKVFSFVGVADLVGVITACLTESLPRRPAVYFAAHPTPVLFRDIIAAVKRHLGIRATARLPVPALVLPVVARTMKLLWRMGVKAPVLTPDKVREVSQWGWVCSPQRSVDEIGARYDCDLDQAIGLAAEDYRQRGWIK